MEESIKQKKQMELQHLSLQFKTYKQTYQNRPLLTKQTNTYLELTKFIAQLAPTILSHYTYILNKEEISYLTTEILIFVEDILSKLKSFSQKLEKKQSMQNIKKGSIEICRVCLHELRTVEVVAAKQQLQNKNQLSRNILRLIKQIEEQGDAFTGQDDLKFFHQLKIALQKKEEVLEICNSQGEQFAKLIQAELKELLSIKELFVQESQFKQTQQNKKGEELKKQVNESLAKQFNSKIPHIIEIVSKNFKKSYQRERRMNSRTAQIQTIDNQGGKIFQLKRKLALSQASFSNLVAQCDKLKWTIQEKDVFVNKLQKQMTHLRDELNKSNYQHQKTYKALQQKNKKYKENVEKLKSKRQLIDKQLDSNGKTMKSITRLKEGQEPQEKKNEEISSEEDFEIRSKKRKVLLNTTKGSAKFLLPTLTKFNKQQNHLITKTEFYEQSEPEIVSNSVQIEQLNKTTVEPYTGDLAIKQQESKIAKMSKTGIQSKNKKQLKKILNQPHAQKLKQKKGPQYLQLKKSKSSEKGHYNQIKTDRSKEAERTNKVRASQNQRLTYKEKGDLPLIKNKSIKLFSEERKESSKRVDSDQEGRQNQHKLDEQERQMRDSIRQVSNKLRENTKERSSYRSNNSAGSASNKQNKQRSILKSSTHHQSKFNHKNNSLKLESNSQEQDAGFEGGEDEERQEGEHQQDEKAILNSTKQSKSHYKKPYLRNSYSKINEEIDKQSYQTPIIGADTPGQAETHGKGSKLSPSKLFQSIQHKTKTKINKNIIGHLQRFFDQINKISLQPQHVNYDKFKSIFTKCIKSQTPKLNRLENDTHLLNTTTKQNNKPKGHTFYNDKSQNQQETRSNILNKDNLQNNDEQINNNQQQIHENDLYKTKKMQQNENSFNMKKNGINQNRNKENILKGDSYKSTPKKYQLNLSDKENNFDKKMMTDFHKVISTNIEKAKQKVQSKQYPLLESKENNKKQPLKYITRDHSSQVVKKTQITSAAIKKRLLTESQEGPFELIQFGLGLFINQQKAFKYQTNFLKKNHKRPITLSIEVQNYIKELYEKLEQLKYLNHQNYQQVCKYLRYPFTNSQKECLHINIIHHINITSLAQCFQKIMPIHSHCKHEHGLCLHLISFKKKISAFVDKYL